MYGKWQVSALKVLFLVIICNRGYDVDRTMCDLVSKNRRPEDVSEEIAVPFAAIIKISGKTIWKVSEYPGANRREARKLGLCRSCTAFAIKP
jgi:hypothetical protein